MKTFLALITLAGASLLAATFVSAQMVECPDRITTYTRVKDVCVGGRMESYYDNNKCLWYKCVGQSSSADCSEAMAKNAALKETCHGQIIDTYDANKCLWQKCADGGTPVNRCADAEANNGNVKANCRGTIDTSWDPSSCVWYKCLEKPMGDACTDAVSNNDNVRASCSADQITRAKVGNCEWLKCGPAKPQPSTDKSVKCIRYGCTVKCDDGGIYNVCLKDCPRPTATPATGGITCSETKTGKCVIRKCTDGSVKRDCSR